jgi:hypothetical protein
MKRCIYIFDHEELFGEYCRFNSSNTKFLD